MTEMKLHPACAVFPAMLDKELAELATDIKTRGLLEPITVMPDGTILDGRNRWLACQQAEVEPVTAVYQGDDPIGFFVSRNLKRRHLSRMQRAMIAAEIANLKNGEHASVITEAVTQDQAAKLMDVSRTAVQDARAVQQRAADHVIAMVKAGEVGLQSAAIAVRGTSKAKQAEWTATDVKAIAKARKEPSRPPKPRQPKQPQFIPYKTLTKWPLSPEERELPPPEIAGEQHPDYPPGVNRMQAHIREHGHVQLWSPSETRQLELGREFIQLCMHIKRLAKGSWPSPADIDGQKPEVAKETRLSLAKDLEPAIALLTAFRDALAASVVTVAETPSKKSN